MRRRMRLFALLCCIYLGLAPAAAESTRILDSDRISTERLEREFFSGFNLSVSSIHADDLLRRQPGSVIALFIRMETAALQQRTDAVLDSALRLCTMPAPPEVQEIASSRILENAGNSRAFEEVLRRVGLAMEDSNACTFNLRLALVAAAADGATRLDLDKTAQSAGLLTRWRIAGPFGRFSNVGFERQWPPETDRFWTVGNSVKESFWFRNGMVAVPDYLSGPGVFYAASEVRTGPQRTSRLDVLSPGPYTISIDGIPVLAKDSRLLSGGNRESLALNLSPGLHRITVKFTADAAPFSVDLHREFERKYEAAALTLEPGIAEYVRILLEYFRGNLSAVERMLDSRADDGHGATLYLRALLWSAAEEHSSRARTLWETLSKSQPSALLARIKAAEFAAEGSPPDEQRFGIADLERQRPESEGVAQLVLNVVRGDSSATVQALSRLLDLHPTCSRMAEALKAYTSLGDQSHAQTLEERLLHCAPDSLEYPRTLSEAGRHQEAAALLRQRLAHNHLDRAARRMLVRELVLSGELAEAGEQAQELHKIEPGSPDFARLAADVATVLDSHSERANGFLGRTEFYAPYRRDGIKAVHSTAQQSFAGSALTFLLYDRVLKIWPDGTASLYSHRVIRLLNKEAIGSNGEVRVPRGADLLELRTIKLTGQAIEPELAQQKPMISMPALEPGDCIEEEFVTNYPDWRRLPASASVFELASSLAPVVSSRIVLLAPKTSGLEIELSNGAPPPYVETTANEVVRSWEVSNTAVIAAEPFAPMRSLLPAVSMVPAENALDRLRDALFDSTRIGPHVIAAVMEQNFPQAISEREKARRLYRLVTSRIESTGSDFSASSAEDTLTIGEGSRTAALLALARAAGLKSGLLMARNVNHLCAPTQALDCYTEPLVRFWAGGEVIDADAQADDLPFGSIPPDLDAHTALLIPLTLPNMDNRDVFPEVISLSARPMQEQSVAEGDLFLGISGTLAASIRIRLGATRAQEVRAILRSGGDTERQNYFEQLASRIFSGATDVRGRVLRISDPEQPLELKLEFSVPHFITAQAGLKEISQLAPVLGFHSFAGKSENRRFPLLQDSLFFESTTFHLHLPPGVFIDSAPRDFFTSGEFGVYAVRFSQQQEQLDVTREFEIPVQVVEPQRFPAFVAFARAIDEAEHRPIMLRVRRITSGMQNMPPQFGNR